MLSISCRALDYLVANKHLLVRRIGSASAHPRHRAAQVLAL
jgi:hypothetical protein